MMKKIYFILITLLIPAYLFGISGSGTSGDPYYGTISTSRTWNSDDFASGEVYVGTSGNNDLTIGTGGYLTINDGVTVIFTQTSSDLIITGTGRLTVNGTNANKVTFTKAAANANWGHIYFNSSSGISLLDYCVIEYGDVGTGSGGGIYILATNNLTVSNSEIRNCAAGYGGGIGIENSSPTIENCLIYDNTGAGIDVLDVSPTITNCSLINNDNANRNEYGGIHIESGSATIINSVFWNNKYRGDNEFDYSGGGTISYSAATQTITGTGMVDLTVLNTGTWGPNFTDPTNDNYYITSVSPLVDAGTTGTTLDILGNSRIGTTDIGAYENQGYTWQGDDVTNPTWWNDVDNWDSGIVPTGSDDNVYIPAGLSNYPTYTPAQDYTIGSGYIMLVAPGAQVTLGTLTNFGTLTLEPGAQVTLGTLTNVGTFTLESDATDIASLMINTYIDAGTENIELYLAGGGGSNYKWHYISAPVSGATPSVFSGITDNILIYRETEVLTDSSIYAGWAWYDGFTSTDVWGPQFTTLDVGRGYNVYDSDNQTYTFNGSLNTSFSSGYSLSFSGDSTKNGYNLLGNPFTCGLDWDEITGDASYPTETSKAIYFTKDNDVASYSNGVGVNGGSASIPPMQGFFVKTYNTGKTITVPLSAKEHNSTTRFKSAEIIPLVRLEISKDGVTDETVVRFNNNALETLDYDFDALKVMRKDMDLLIWSTLFETEFSINGIPFPENSIDIPLAINSPIADTLKITATQIQGLEDYDLTLKDIDQDVSVDLNQVNEYIFAADSGTVTDRFILTITNLATGLPDIFEPEPEKAFNIYSSREILYIKPVKNEWNGRRTDLRIYDITGKLIKQQKNIEWYKGVTKEISLSVAQGIYIIEISSATERYVGKVSVVR